ncbi:Oidioi.mRNA.OKI2018_I69.PAR.g9706.t1.cds [Oikopleura dioica]|uniref:Oidioi.mRNA.OKI2018_I69.PAR.g9706.t1.cds n=1 Tax=Oikopleura dioica TaxID=34765 RepID=A0ABN7RLV7_OIKDI|nr:Oidioi.mRNA.OKI2018_I69.PAR.g9706.t1.cds [Oikopleura dioica]
MEDELFGRKKMPKKNKEENPSPASAAPASGLIRTAKDIYASTTTSTMPSFKLYRHEPQNKELAEKVRKIVKQSPMGAGGSKERAGRSQRSAAQRLLDQRRSTGQGQKFRPPSRSKSVGDGIEKQSPFQALPPAAEFKSVENLPKEIRDKFDPTFAKELHTIVRQKSQRRELFGFSDPTAQKNANASNPDLFSEIENSFKSSTPRSPRRSDSEIIERATMRSKTSQKPSPENRKSAHEALFPGYRTLPSTSAPKSDPLFANGNFNGTNNSAKGANYSSLGNLKKSNFSSKTSLVSSEYDNVKKSPRQAMKTTEPKTSNRPTHRSDQPPPRTSNDNVTLLAQSSLMKLLNRSQGNTDKSSTGGHSHQSSKSDLENSTPPSSNPISRRPKSGADYSTPAVMRTNVRPSQKAENTDNRVSTISSNGGAGRMFCVSSREPMLICRNSACSNQATLKQAKAQYKSCRYCVTFYCTKECRAEHWHKHKDKCVYAKAASLAKLILHQINHSQLMMHSLSKIVAKEERSKGRGAVRVVVSSIKEAEEFVLRGFAALSMTPQYLPQSELDPEMSAIADKYSLDDEILVDVMLRITNMEKLAHSRPYRTNSDFVSTGSRMKRPQDRFVEIRKGHTSSTLQKVVQV